jgi:nitroreductase
MNEILKSLKERKSCRAYEERPIGPAEKAIILDAALQAPSGGNMALYGIIDVTDPQLKQRLSVTCDNQPFIAAAPLVLVFLADYQRWYDVFAAEGLNPRHPAEGDLLLSTVDATIAAHNTVVAAESLGIGSCYIGDIIENYEIHREILNLPKYALPMCMLCFGYPTAQQIARKKPPRPEISALVHENTYERRPPDAYKAALQKQQDKSDEELKKWIDAFCTRKFNSDFSEEMSRSARAMLKAWCE